MFLAHYGVALAAKGISSKDSLGATVFGSQWLDLLWPVLLLAGLERVQVVPGLMAASSLDFESYPISHSLLAVLGWGVVIGGLYGLSTRRARGALLLGGLVVSHWLLDAPMHRPDLPLWPGSRILVGAGLWNSLPLTLILELGLLAAGAAVYLRVTAAKDGIGRWGLWAMLSLLALFYLSSLAGPPPSQEALGWGGLVLWVFVPWAAWVDRHRGNRKETRPV